MASLRRMPLSVLATTSLRALVELGELDPRRCAQPPLPPTSRACGAAPSVLAAAR